MFFHKPIDDIDSAVSVDLFGKEVPSDISVCGNEVRLSVKSHCIGQVELKF